MQAAKPVTLEEYKGWLRAVHSMDSIEQQRMHYGIVSGQMKLAFQGSPFWRGIISPGTLRDFDEEYRLANANYPLFSSLQTPDLLVKSFDSFFLKTHRINVLENGKWPGPPRWLGQVGWILPSNWFSRINDIVRTLFVVKYFDGVKFLLSKLGQECDNTDTRHRSVLQAREEGHYAAHFYVTEKCEITSIHWSPEIVPIAVEVQITTQLQDVIRMMLHKHYESRRQRTDRSDDWKWDHKSSEFATNYLGHILHYLEGMIVEIRDRQKEQP